MNIFFIVDTVGDHIRLEHRRKAERRARDYEYEEQHRDPVPVRKPARIGNVRDIQEHERYEAGKVGIVIQVLLGNLGQHLRGNAHGNELPHEHAAAEQRHIDDRHKRVLIGEIIVYKRHRGDLNKHPGTAENTRKQYLTERLVPEHDLDVFLQRIALFGRRHPFLDVWSAQLEQRRAQQSERRRRDQKSPTFSLTGRLGKYRIDDQILFKFFIGKIFV